MYRITVDEIKRVDDTEDNPGDTMWNGTPVQTTRRYEQVVNDLDLLALMSTVNKRPRKARTPKPAAVKAA